MSSSNGNRTRWILAASLALLLSSAAAQADPLAGARNQVSALAVLPWDVGDTYGGRITTVVLSNGGPAPEPPLRMRLHVLVIYPNFHFTQFVCPVIPNDTTSFTFERDPQTGSPVVRYNCQDAILPPPTQHETTLSLAQSSGIIFISHEEFSPWQPGGATSGVNTLFANATVWDVVQGSAYSFDAIHFTGDAPNRDRSYKFDNREFSAFPSTVATNYILPTKDYGTPGITADLILFTIDGTLSSAAAPSAAVHATFFDEAGIFAGTGSITLQSASVQVVNLATYKPDLVSPPSKSLAASVILTPGPVQRNDGVHDAPRPLGSGNGDGFRMTPVHGWIVQTAPSWTAIPGSYGPAYSSGALAWARALDSGEVSVPRNGDTYALRAPCGSFLTEPDENQELPCAP
jgi:hypothetical protein